MTGAKSLTLIRWLFIAQGIIWVGLGIGYYFYYLNKLDMMVVRVMVGLMVAFSIWLILIGIFLREKRRLLYLIAIATILLTILLTIFDEFGFMDLIVLLYNLFTLFLLIKNWKLVLGNQKNRPAHG